MKLSPTPISLWHLCTKGPLPFILGYSLAVLSPLAIARALGLEHGTGKREFASGCGMVALMLFLTAFILSGRFNWVSGKRGLDLTLKFHRRVAGLALIFGLLHIFLIAPFSMPDHMFLAAIPMLLVLLIAFFAKGHSKMQLRYEWWRLSHGILAIVIVVMLTAHAILDGSYSSHLVLATYWMALTFIAIGSLFYVHSFRPWQESKRPYQLTEVIQEANNQWTLTMEPQGFEAMTFEPGQYAFVSFGATPFKDRAHPFSFSSCPSDRPRISFTIKAVGDFTKTIGDLKVGSNAYLYGPYGHMSRDHHRGPAHRGRGAVFMATGVGFTPMMSILREMRAQKDPDPVHVFYSCRHEKDILYRDELEAMKKDLNMNLHLLLSQPPEHWTGENGRIDANYLKNNLTFEQYQAYIYFVCGTTGFVQDMEKALGTISDIPLFNIRFEDFSVYS